MSDLDSLIARITALSPEEQKQILRHVRGLLPPHPMEARLKASAETVLEAIQRANDLSIRGIEGLLAEASFATEVLPSLSNWEDKGPPAGAAFDFLLEQRGTPGAVRMQVKMQRRKDHLPLTADQVYKTTRKWPADHFVVEVQRTRGGSDGTGKGTRPYRFGEFDLLGVSLGASRGHWHAFTYTVANWLIADPTDSDAILTYQPVAPNETEEWTTDFRQAVSWFRAGIRKKIPG